MHSVSLWWRNHTRYQYLARLAMIWLTPAITILFIFTHRAILWWLGMYDMAQSDVGIVLLMVWLAFATWGCVELTAKLNALYMRKTHGQVPKHDQMLVDTSFVAIGQWSLRGATVAIYMWMVLLKHINAIFADARNGEAPDVFNSL